MIILFQGLGQKNIYPNNNLTTRYDDDLRLKANQKWETQVFRLKL